jgi:hypothetical protein
MKFSFVLDWFVDTTAVVDKLDNLLTGNTKTVTSISLSEKAESLVASYFHNSFAWDLSISGQNIVNNTVKLYQRNPVALDSYLGLSGKFGKHQAGLAAALLTQTVANFVAKKRRSDSLPF